MTQLIVSNILSLDLSSTPMAPSSLSTSPLCIIHTIKITHFPGIFLLTGADFESLNKYLLTFDPMDPINTTRCVNISINNENLVEYNENFTIFLEPVGPVHILPDNNKTITILNDDCKYNSRLVKLNLFHCNNFINNIMSFDKMLQLI